MIYLDNAATTSPKPVSVKLAVKNAMEKLTANPGRSGHKDSQRAADVVYSCRNAIADFFNFGYPERVVFTANCTQSLNTVIKGLDLSGGVVTSNIEHNAVTRPLYKLSKQGIRVDFAEVDIFDESKTIKNFEKLIHKGTSLVICTHVSNVLGIKLPIEKIAEICSANNVVFAVDGAQSAGVETIDLQKTPINFLCCPGHKGLYGPMGTGFIICNGELKNTIIEGGTGNRSIIQEQPDEYPEKFESGTVNIPGIAGLKAGIEFVKNKRPNIVKQHEIKLIQQAYNELSKIKNVLLYTSYPKIETYGPVLSFNIKGVDSMQVGSMLNENNIAVRAGLHCAPSAHRLIGTLNNGAVRISPAVFNTSKDIELFIKVIKNISKM